ncbi:MAG: hypothetical protein WC919_01435 [Candidatus Paceibacterota bacterium]|jgi:hypothetical protein
MNADRVRKKLVSRILRYDTKIHTLVELFEAMGDEEKEMRREIAETIAEILYPDGIARIAEVIHPNGMIS